MTPPDAARPDPSGPPLGAPPSYSTRHTLTLALLTIPTALLHGGLGATDYTTSRALGTGYMLLAGLILVHGILLLIRYAEAHDAMHDPLPRTPMYATRHERLNHHTGLALHATAATTATLMAATHHTVAVHVIAAALSVLAATLHHRTRPT